MKFNKLKVLIVAIIALLIIITLSTKYYGSTDVGDYLGVSKYFSGEFNAKLRTSHTLLYGVLHAPFSLLFNDVLLMKITSIIFLILIGVSLFSITKNKKVLLLFFLSPITWYLAPWISPLQIVSLLFLWSFFFIEKYNRLGKIKNLIYSGLLIGLIISFWNGAVFIIFFLILSYFYNKNVNHLFIFLFSMFVGYLPNLILDYLAYGSTTYTLLKFIFANFAMFFYGGIYNQFTASSTFFTYLSFVLMIPLYTYLFYKKSFFRKNQRFVIFLTLSFLFLLLNPQIRYVLFLYPLILLFLPKLLNKKQFKNQLIIFSIISLLVTVPYAIQIKYSTNSSEFSSFLNNLGNIHISEINQKDLIIQDLDSITSMLPNESFVVGNNLDDYAELALIYFGKDIQEFVSIQDYELWLKNDSTIFKKTIKFVPKIQDRREIWISGGMSKSENDNTDYASITYAIGLREPVNLKDFELIKNYSVLYLSEKANK